MKMRFTQKLYAALKQVLVVAACLLSLPASAPADLIAIDPRATYLRTNNDNALDATAIDLGALSFPANPGDAILLERVGEYSPYPAFGDMNESMVAVFSSGATLLSNNNLARVVGAIDAGTDFMTAPTAVGGLTTDILQDFLISAPTGGASAVLVQVPIGARFLFVTAHDNFFGDNADPNQNYGIRITSAVPEPSSLALLEFGGLCMVIAAWRRRARSRGINASSSTFRVSRGNGYGSPGEARDVAASDRPD